MVWRIHFTADDLARIQVSSTLGPLAETVMALSLLRSPQPPRAWFGPWRTEVLGKLTPRMKPLTDLIPAGGLGVDLCTLTGEALTIEQGVQALLDVPREQLLAELEFTDRQHQLPETAWAMAEPAARDDLADAAEAAYRVLIQPYWPRLHHQLYAEQAARSRMLAYHGADALLASLQSERIRWRPPVLEVLVPCYADTHLAGRGIELLPAVFVGSTPTLHEDLTDPSGAPRLMLPVADDGNSQLWGGPRPQRAALAALVGRNRAAVLGSIANGCTTTELADRAGISLAAASQHASVLRDAGLVVTRRHGRAVLHVLTPLGIELLEAG